MATLNDQLINMGCSSRLATFIRFDHFDFEDPSLFVKTLAYQLASFDSQIARKIADVLERQPKILNHSRLLEQLQTLVLQPLQQCTDMHHEGPIVVLIDGLDECMQEPGGSSSFRQLLSLLSDPQTFSKFPFLRFIIASRPEGCIRQEFLHKEHIHCFSLDITSAETKADIGHYLAVKFKSIYAQNPAFKALCTELDAVQGLSERATTIFRFVEGLQTEQRLKAVLALTPPRDALTALTNLYTTILATIVVEGDVGIRSLILAILGLTIAHAQIPLHPSPTLKAWKHIAW
ncbi:hypothetical protein L218DRAFT_974915 [Marasmius fiardii PR-910]|nr:hypothetical protein L218DRAFT_974915 [Marasmius fiardii PR-910]